MYESIKADNKDVPTKDLMKLISRNYDSLPSKVKDKYTEEYKKEMVAYKVQIEKWSAMNPG